MAGFFPDQEAALAALKQDWLNIPLLEGADLSDQFISDQLEEAEHEAEMALRVFLSPTIVLPENATQEEKDALDLAGTRWVEEPGYDMEPEFFQGDRWGYLLTRHKPIISVERMSFVYPLPMSDIFDVPADWIRVDKKYGHIRLVPGTQAFAAPLSAWIMRVMGGGRTIPHMIQLRYTAGIHNAASRFPALRDLIKRLTTIRILQTRFFPASTSISADGLSESRSVDLSKDMDEINTHFERLRQSIHGVEMMVLG